MLKNVMVVPVVRRLRIEMVRASMVVMRTSQSTRLLIPPSSSSGEPFDGVLPATRSFSMSPSYIQDLHLASVKQIIVVAAVLSRADQ